MQSWSPTYNVPSTPTASRTPLQHRPLNSSPLAPQTPKMSSPLGSTPARRRSQYKAQIPSTPSSAGRFLASRTPSNSGETPEDDPQKAFLRSRFKARCLERAVRARKDAIRKRRVSMPSSEPNSDDYPMEDDEDEDDEVVMQDELFRRIVANENKKERYAYKVSYAREVGSSFDPDMEDINDWEQELAGEHLASTPVAGPSNTAYNYIPESSEASWLEEPLPEEYGFGDEEELEAYAEEYAKRAAIADFEDISPDELFNWSDGEDVHSTPDLPHTPREPHDDVMDMS